jgi:hypothetical protein
MPDNDGHNTSRLLLNQSPVYQARRAHGATPRYQLQANLANGVKFRVQRHIKQTEPLCTTQQAEPAPLQVDLVHGG